MFPFSFRVALRFVAFVAALSSWALSGDAHAAGPVLTADGDPRAGHVTLSWQGQETSPTATRAYELQESRTADFDSPRVRYEGPQTSSVLSGIPNGTLFYRVRAKTPTGAWGAWSDPVQFDVKHHSLATAGALMAIGAIVFAMTAWFVANGEVLAKE